MKILVAFSGGKDSQASLIWAVREFGVDKVTAVFCDTGWEHALTYQHVIDVTNQMGVKLVTVRSKKYRGMLDLAKKKGRFPSTKARFCTEELKSKPMIDYILDEVKDHCLIIQGIRADESLSRSKMQKNCTYFKHYFEPYDDNRVKLNRLINKSKLTTKELINKVILTGKVSKGKLEPKFLTYRKVEVVAFCKLFAQDVIRPLFNKTGQEVMRMILEAGQKANPLYYQGLKRVGCYPCVMCTHSEVLKLIENDPDYVERVREAEQEVGKTFFPPKYIPQLYATKLDYGSGKKVNSMDDVKRYLSLKYPPDSLLPPDDNQDRRCMSFYGICE